jgi:carbazole 1,9a-dioxygenase
VQDGRLVAIVTDPESALIGKVAIKTYPVEEQKGVVFVFVGDVAPPPLALDVQPGFLDEGLAIFPRGERERVESNWRLAAENGFDWWWGSARRCRWRR